MPTHPQLQSRTACEQFSGARSKSLEATQNRKKDDGQQSQSIRRASGPTQSANYRNASSEMPDEAVPRCELSEPQVFERLKAAPISPPITKETLRELDLGYIMHNLNLRVDVNHDHDLHFMPIKGPRGDQKREEAKFYWRALAEEFRVYRHNLLPCSFCCHAQQPNAESGPRLPQMFASLRDLLMTLVPDRDHDAVEERFDIPLLMQQVYWGALDIVSLARWIAELLKSHCAPMRDDWADEMAAMIEEGAKLSDMNKLVEGLEKLFSLMEAMKLDVANHQIRSLRHHLIEGTVPFQRAVFERKLRDGKLSVDNAQVWYRNTLARHRSCTASPWHGTRLAALGNVVHGILESCTDTFLGQLPETLTFDNIRIGELRLEVQDMIYLRLCEKTVNRLCARSSGWIGHAQQAQAPLNDRIMAIISDAGGDQSPNRWQSHVGDIALELVRATRGPREVCDEFYKEAARKLYGEFAYSSTSTAASVFAEIEARVFSHITTFWNMSALAISESQKSWHQKLSEKTSLQPDPEDIARRIAHMVVLHWRVWGDLVYLNNDGVSEAQPGSIITCATADSNAPKSHHPHTRLGSDTVKDLGVGVNGG